MASIYKGVPKSEWARVRAEHEAKKGQTPPDPHAMPNAFAAETAFELPPEEKPAPQVKKQTPKSIPRNLFSGIMRELDVYGLNGSTTDPIPGYRLYWFNDIGGTGVRLNQARMSGWEFVGKDEVALNENLVPGNNDLGTQVCKVVGPNQIPPLKAYLMKKPRWLDEAHKAEKETVHRRIDAALKKGTLGAKPEDRQYTAQAGSNLPQIEISSNLYKQGDVNG